MNPPRNPRNAGAKPKYGVKTQKISLHVPDPLHDRLMDAATRSDRTKSEVAIEAMETGLNQPETGAFE